MPILIEPALFIYAGESGSFTATGFQAFLAGYKTLDAFCDINRQRFIMSADLVEAVRALFPFGTVKKMPAGSEVEAHLQFGATEAILRVLDRWSIAPLAEFADVADEWRVEPSLCRIGVYDNGDVWLSWHDLIAQAASVHCTRSKRVEFLATDKKMSCLSVDAAVVTQTATGQTAILLALRRQANGTWPEPYIDPARFHDLMARRGPLAPPVIWEDSGHQPSAALKKLIIRTAAASGIVIRAGSTWFNPNLAETCKVAKTAKIAEIEFRVSDGQSCVKGLFSTIARDAVEQDICLVLLTRDFKQRCAEAGFAIAM
jgi:hypothetical protein